ncbi:hypothetical protein BDZ91DRAFT_747445 [Kalaharituber pfeilii]|nr:hypothetical protein BDZ91DRAFT_747445 [Kalaharituber pfeilii]
MSDFSYLFEVCIFFPPPYWFRGIWFLGESNARHATGYNFSLCFDLDCVCVWGYGYQATALHPLLSSSLPSYAYSYRRRHLIFSLFSPTHAIRTRIYISFVIFLSFILITTQYMRNIQRAKRHCLLYLTCSAHFKF